jgi:hypothetical protein
MSSINGQEKRNDKLSGAKYIFLYSKESGKNKFTVPIPIEKQAVNTIWILSIDRSPCIPLPSSLPCRNRWGNVVSLQRTEKQTRTSSPSILSWYLVFIPLLLITTLQSYFLQNTTRAMRKQPGRGQGASRIVERPAAIQDGTKDYCMDKRLSEIIGKLLL